VIESLDQLPGHVVFNKTTLYRLYKAGPIGK
jgi:hypothetical protein